MSFKTTTLALLSVLTVLSFAKNEVEGNVKFVSSGLAGTSYQIQFTVEGSNTLFTYAIDTEGEDSSDYLSIADSIEQALKSETALEIRYTNDHVVTQFGREKNSKKKKHTKKQKKTAQNKSGIQAWSQPSGSHDAYQMGAQVYFNGAAWESTRAANVWTPLELPSGWREIE